MRSYIITGSLNKRNKFISEYIEKEKIPNYSITYFNEEIKVEEAKLLRKILSRRYSEKSLIVINSSLNQIAQNALLKSTEELSEYISIIISINDLNSILETIKSRFFIAQLVHEDDLGNDIASLTSFNNISEKMILIDKFLLDNSDLSSEEQVNKFIKLYRKDLLSNLENFGKDELRDKVKVLKNLLPIASLIKSNNVNLRLGLESALI